MKTISPSKDLLNRNLGKYLDEIILFHTAQSILSWSACESIEIINLL